MQGFSSKDLLHWTSLGEAFNNVDKACGGNETIGLCGRAQVSMEVGQADLIVNDEKRSHVMGGGSGAMEGQGGSREAACQ